MILVIENRKGEEFNYLSSFQDYMGSIEKACSDSIADRSFAVEELFETKQRKGEWGEIYITSNKTYHARFCTGESDLRGFLRGYYNQKREGEKQFTFDEKRCSKECLEVLKAYGINIQGKSILNSLHYEAKEHTFMRGEILKNMNGDYYRVLSVLEGKNLLLIAESDGQILVGVNTTYFQRTPKGEYGSSDSEIFGVEWAYGIYFGYDITKVDFEKVKREYGSKEEIKSLSDYRDGIAYKFNKYQKLCEDMDVSGEVRKAAADNMNKIFGTDNKDTFQSFLKRAYYDSGYQGEIEEIKEKVR